MKNALILIILAIFLMSCNVTESIVFNQDGSGKFLVSYDMGEAVTMMNESMGGGENIGKVMDTTMVFAEIMETYKDSIAALPDEKQKAMEAVKDMFMTMKMNEDEGVMKIGIGLKFEGIDDLKNIQKKLKQAQSLNVESDQIGAIKSKSPLGNFMGNDNAKVDYSYTNSQFSRTTKLTTTDSTALDLTEDLFDESDSNNQQFMDYFENAYYNVSLTFPRPIKSVSIKNAEFSNNRKTVTYRINWIDYLKNPLVLDANLILVDE